MSPLDIFQSALDAVTQAVRDGDFPAYMALIRRGITHYERVARSADYVSRDRIEGWHHSHLIVDGVPVAHPHLSRHVLVLRGARWLFSEAQYDQIEAKGWPLTETDFFGHVDAAEPDGEQLMLDRTLAPTTGERGLVTPAHAVPLIGNHAGVAQGSCFRGLPGVPNTRLPENQPGRTVFRSTERSHLPQVELTYPVRHLRYSRKSGTAVLVAQGRRAQSRLAAQSRTAKSHRVTQRNSVLTHRLSTSIHLSVLLCLHPCGRLFSQRNGGANTGLLLAKDPNRSVRKEMNSVQSREILQTYLDVVGKAVLSERFEEYCSLIQLPLNIQTSSAKLKVTTVDDLQEGFDEYCDMMRNLGVTDMVRTVKAAEFKGNDHIVGIYETRLMADMRQALPTFHSKMWIGCYGGIWKAVQIYNTTKETRWPMLYTRLASDTWPIEE